VKNKLNDIFNIYQEFESLSDMIQYMDQKGQLDMPKIIKILGALCDEVESLKQN